MIYFTSDYTEGCHERILRRLTETNYEQTPGYGTDYHCQNAARYILTECGREDAWVHFLVGGTQTNMTLIAAALRPHQGAVCAESGHIHVHETGAVEATGHKCLTLPSPDGKISAEQVRELVRLHREDESMEHTVQPGLVYISNPTEYGTIYSLAELEALSAVCREAGIPLYLDGARLAYALATPSNDAALPDLARLCDAFYIGGTKCGALLGEAVVFPRPDVAPHFFTIVKQHGALLAKGRVAGIQFDTLFTDDLYMKISRHAIEMAALMRSIFRAKGYEFFMETTTNQIFITLTDERKAELEKQCVLSFWEKPDAEHTVVRFATSWATAREDVLALAEIL